MRVLIFGLFACASVCLAAEPPADPQAATSPGAESAIAAPEHPAGAAEADRAREPTPAKSESTTGEISAPAAEAAPADPAEAAKAQAEKEKAEAREFAKAGYKATTIGGETKFCEVYNNSGSRLGRKLQCYSADQVRARMASQSGSQKR